MCYCVCVVCFVFYGGGERLELGSGMCFWRRHMALNDGFLFWPLFSDFTRPVFDVTLNV